MNDELKNKKVGDQVVVCSGYESRPPITCVVEKVGRKYLHSTVEGKKMIFCRETGTMRVRYWRPELGRKEACWSPEWRAYASKKGKTMVDKQEHLLRRLLTFIGFELDPEHSSGITSDDMEVIEKFMTPIINRGVAKQAI
jgi:hypothetical protein